MEEYLQNKTLLLVDDTPENIDVLNGMLGVFKRKIATNGERALKIASSSTPPDLILLDIMMPGMDGYEVATRLRANESTKDIPIIFLTAKTAKEDIVKGFEAGGQDYVTKPFDPSELMERVKTQLKLRHQQKMLENMNEVLEQKVQERTAQLEEAFEKLKVLDEAKSNFLKLISHEIRTPLNGIVGSTYFLEDMIKDPDLKEFMEILKESVERLEHFSINALFLTQLDTKRLETQLQPVDLAKAIEKALEENEKIRKEKNIKIDYNSGTTSPVTGDEQLILKSLTELIHNAAKFSADNKVTISSFEKDNKVFVEIVNTGEDIPEEKLQSITEAFGMADQHMDKNAGLGLAIVNACQNLMSGELAIESRNRTITATLSYQKE